MISCVPEMIRWFPYSSALCDGVVIKNKQGESPLRISIQRYFIPLTVALMLVLSAVAAAESVKEKTKKQKLLERYARESLFRLKQAIKSDGFYNARVSLNIWKSNAIDAGIYDEAQYDTFKGQIYRKSINENLRWFEIFLNLKSYTDARTCLQLWRIHSEEIGIFDESQYEELKKRLK